MTRDKMIKCAKDLVRKHRLFSNEPIPDYDVILYIATAIVDTIIRHGTTYDGEVAMRQYLESLYLHAYNKGKREGYRIDKEHAIHAAKLDTEINNL